MSVQVCVSMDPPLQLNYHCDDGATVFNCFELRTDGGRSGRMTLQAIHDDGRPSGLYVRPEPMGDGFKTSLSATRPHVWDTVRFHGGGCAFYTTVANESGASVLYITDSQEGKLYSEAQCGGAPAFILHIRFPPVIDIAPLLSLHGKENTPPGQQPTDEPLSPNRAAMLAALQRDLASACQEVGFFYIKGHGLDPKPLLDRLIDRCKQLEKFTKVTLKTTTGLVKTNFNPPQVEPVVIPGWLCEVEEPAVVSPPVGPSPVSPPPVVEELPSENGTEASAVVVESTGVVEGQAVAVEATETLKAILEIPPTVPKEEDPVASNGNGTDHAPEQAEDAETAAATTKRVVSTEDLVDEYYAAARAVAIKLLTVLLKKSVDEDEMLYLLFRAVCYPSEENRKTEDSLDPHSDKTWITLLAASDIDGLEMVDCDGATFTPVNVPKGVLGKESAECPILVNVGDALQIQSRHEFISRMHRARNKSSDPSQPRVSLPLFVEPRPDRWPASAHAQAAAAASNGAGTRLTVMEL